MSNAKMRDCTYCHGRGWIGVTLLDRKNCRYCNGRGAVPVKEKRKSILISHETHASIKDLAYDHRMTVLAFVAKMVEEYQEKYMKE